jgi:hypothetical protein
MGFSAAATTADTATAAVPGRNFFQKPAPPTAVARASREWKVK